MCSSDVNGGSGSPSKILFILLMPCSMTSHPSAKRIGFWLRTDIGRLFIPTGSCGNRNPNTFLRIEATQRNARRELKQKPSEGSRWQKHRRVTTLCIDEGLYREGREVVAFRSVRNFKRRNFHLFLIWKKKIETNNYAGLFPYKFVYKILPYFNNENTFRNYFHIIVIFN